jgi:tetratricopeptide (TPR) repeat protein
MKPRIALMLAGAALLLAGGAAWWLRAPEAVAVSADEVLPVPPVPPRIAEGPDYENCLAMLPNDPAGAAATAEAWQQRGGGEAATHCLALSHVELGDAALGAKMLDALATASHAPTVARAAVFDQADQAWLMAGDMPRAYDSASHAVALSPDDVDLLVNHAVAAAALSRFAEAKADLDQALEQDGRRADALVLRGSAERQLGQLDLASTDIDRALAVDPENAEGLLERGILRQRDNDQIGAREDWERAISIDPDSTTADLAQQNLALLDAGPQIP